MASTVYAPHDNHGTIVGVEMATRDADSLLGEFYRTGVDVVTYDFLARSGEPMDVWAQRDHQGNVRLVVETV